MLVVDYYEQDKIKDINFKRYKGDKIVSCFCERNQEILVGNAIYKFINIVGIALCSIVLIICLCIMIIWPNIYAIIFIALSMFVGVVLPLYDFKSSVRFMVKNGHDVMCSKNIARMTTIRAGQNARFMILNYKEKNNETSTK